MNSNHRFLSQEKPVYVAEGELRGDRTGHQRNLRGSGGSNSSPSSGESRANLALISQRCALRSNECATVLRAEAVDLHVSRLSDEVGNWRWGVLGKGAKPLRCLYMDRHSNAGQSPWHAGAKDIRLGFDRGFPKPRRDVEPGQSSAEIIGERRQRTTMHMAAVVDMTVIDIEFAYQLILVGVGNSDAEMFRHTGMGGGRGHRRAPIRGRNSGRSYSNVNRHRWLMNAGVAVRIREARSA